MTLPGFHECPECGGDGICKVASHSWFGGEPTEKPHDCPECGGAGQVPDDDTAEWVTDHRSDTTVRAVLLAYARHTHKGDT